MSHYLSQFFLYCFLVATGRDSLVGIATRYGLDGPEIECRSQRPSGLRRGSAADHCWDCGFESHRRHGCLCCVCCTIRTKGNTPGQSGQSSIDKVQSEKKIPVGGEIFRTRSDWACGPTSLLLSAYRVSFPEVKQLGSDVKHPPPSSSDVKERGELYL